MIDRARRILDELGSHAPAKERRALRALVAIGPRATGPLARLAREHPNAHARGVAVAALARLAGPRARRTLYRALGDPTMVVRLHALVALHRRAWGPGAAHRVRGLLRDPSGGVRINAVDVLAAHRARSAVPDLVRCLRDEKPYVRRQAARALESLGWRPA